MAIRDIFKISRKTFFNPTGWIDYDSLKVNTETIVSILKGLFTVPKAPAREEETFKDAMQRQGLTEADVQSAIKNYRLFAILFLILGLLALGHSFYLLFVHGTLAGLLLGLSAAALFFGQAFKYDFWSFQMRSRKLGATVEEWKRSFFSKGTLHD